MLIRLALLVFIPLLLCYGSAPDAQKEYVESYLAIAPHGVIFVKMRDHYCLSGPLQSVLTTRFVISG